MLRDTNHGECPLCGRWLHTGHPPFLSYMNVDDYLKDRDIAPNPPYVKGQAPCLLCGLISFTLGGERDRGPISLTS